MKKILFHLFLLASLFMAACHDDNGGPSSIVIDKDQQNQTAYADDTEIQPVAKQAKSPLNSPYPPITPVLTEKRRSTSFAEVRRSRSSSNKKEKLKTERCRMKILRPMEYVKSLKSLLPPTANRITSYLPTMNKDVYKNTHCIKKSPVRKKQNT